LCQNLSSGNLDTWGATSITVRADDSPATPLGAQDVVVKTTADGDVTKEQALMVYNSTENFSATKETVDLISAVYVDGVHIGYTDDTPIEINPTFQTEDVMSNNRLYPITTNVTGMNCDVKFTMIQIDGANYAMVTGATWNSGTKMLTMTGTPTIGTHSVVIVEKSGNQTFIPNCQLITPSSILLGGKTHKKLPITLRAFPIADDASVVYEMYLP